MIETIIATFIALNSQYFITQNYVTCGEAEIEIDINPQRDMDLDYVAHLEIELDNSDKCLLIMALK